ncbi:MAG: rhodanese-like domain-containing protein [Lactobacillus sp.]|uniref:Rhodanese-like domain-containing protein n=1 Tax=Bombilactobacillus bombi TaxID=1303590 RepID=A0A347SQK6_9LACO|nr:rhodanese-like domain-containing protein [Bombilactobacillus bombi]MCO6541680.1 rhodanese-like domain-containing protein [Lactobacillus sp.]MCO6543061.1 rhodanese-like domain-containing protein [Lactobacillus sp.]RHW48351.1 rhodanese-like domain-containing protein [Bombilactobacillus bombi]RHW49613.1 rhodanese-like domain-containing protein [Bombilactobacillus bombi]
MEIVSFLNSLILVIAIFLIYYGGSWLYYRLRAKQLGGELDNEQFEATMRKAQLVDLREKKYFDAGHILGARNLPYTQLKMLTSELRSDLPVYLYEQGSTLSIRAALKLKKLGFQDVKWLKKGFNEWNGKTKKTTKL